MLQTNVTVEGWSKPRIMRILNDKVFIEVVIEDCHCNKCIMRFLSLLKSMEERKISFIAGSFGKDVSIGFPLNIHKSPMEILSFSTGLKVEEA